MMSYQHPSIELSTSYDPPVDLIEVPAELRQMPGAVFLEEGIIRPSHEFARFRQGRALVGLHLADPSLGARIVLPLVADDFGLGVWRRFGGTTPGENNDVSDVGRHRVVSVTVQGRPHTVAVLRRSDAEDEMRHRVVIDLSPEQIGPEGVVFIDFVNVEAPWQGDRAFPDPLVGVGVPVLWVKEPGERPIGPRLSGVRRSPGVDRVDEEPGFFGIVPGAEGGALELTLEPVAPPAQRTHRFRTRHAGDAGRHLTVETATLDGVRAVYNAERRAGTWHVELPVISEPILVRTSSAGPWHATVTRCEPDVS